MIGFFGFRAQWPSGLLIYWLSFNIFNMSQQIYLIRKYHRNPTAVGPQTELANVTPSLKPATANGAQALPASGNANGGGGSRAARRRRSSRR